MALSDVCELRLGQQTSTFLQYLARSISLSLSSSVRYRLPMLQHLSFSLIYKPTHGEVTALDLTCKDEFEWRFRKSPLPSITRLSDTIPG